MANLPLVIPPELARHPFRARRSLTDPPGIEQARELLAGVLAEIRQAKQKLDVRENEDWWYRGQGGAFELRPGLFRLLERDFNQREHDPKSIYELEYDLYFEFACRGPGMQEAGLTSWDKLFCMQHHRLPTRLLDWSEHLGMALFFALTAAGRPEEGVPTIWILAPGRLNEIVCKDRDLYSPRYLGYDWEHNQDRDYEDYLIREAGKFNWEGPVAIYPEQKNVRMRSQHGLFTIFGKDTRPLEQQQPEVVCRIEIPEAAVPAAKEFLAEAGLDEALVYPDLDGFARALRTRYGI